MWSQKRRLKKYRGLFEAVKARRGEPRLGMERKWA